MKRLFFALELEAEAKAGIRQIQSSLKSQLKFDEVRFINPENLHLTLYFLGDQSESKLEKFQSLVRNIAAEFNAFEISIAGRSNITANVLAMDILRGSREIIRIQSALAEKLLQDFGISDSRSFTPHLTIGRPRFRNRRISPKTKALLEQFEIDTKINSIVLFESKLQPSGAVYSALEKCRLKSN